MTDPSNRNPVIVPKRDVNRKVCPKCSSGRWVGRNLEGLVMFTCQDCNHQWYGGVGQLPQDPTVPVPPMNPADKPAVEVVAVRNRHGEIVGTEEIRNHKVDLTQDFRRNGFIPEDEEF